MARTRKNAVRQPDHVDEDSNPEDVLRLPQVDDLVMDSGEGEVELRVEPGDW
jgi:hypothetical protein